MPIPNTKPAPVVELSRQLILIYGAPKAGKTTLAAQFPDSIFLATEAGLNNTDAMRWVYDAAKPSNDSANYVIRKWEDLLSAAREIVAGKTHRTIIIDTIGNACALADRYICEKAGEEYKGDGKLGYGKGGSMIASEIKRFLTGLSGTGIGVVLIAHATSRAVSTPAGEITKTAPHIPGDTKDRDVYNLILGMCDLVLYTDMGMDGKRQVRTKPRPTYDAGDRSGRLPDPVECSHAAIAAAFAPAAAKPAAK